MIMRRFQKGEIFDHAQVSERVNFSIRRICQKRETEHMPERKVFSREMSPEKRTGSGAFQKRRIRENI